MDEFFAYGDVLDFRFHDLAACQISSVTAQCPERNP